MNPKIPVNKGYYDLYLFMKLSNKMCALQNRTPKNLLDT